MASPALGCVNFGARTDQAEARRIIDRGLARGVTVLDPVNGHHVYVS